MSYLPSFLLIYLAPPSTFPMSHTGLEKPSFYDISFWVKVTVLGPTSHISFFELVTNISTLLVPEVRIVFLQNLFYAFTLSNSWFLEVVHLKV